MRRKESEEPAMLAGQFYVRLTQALAIWEEEPIKSNAPSDWPVHGCGTFL